METYQKPPDDEKEIRQSAEQTHACLSHRTSWLETKVLGKLIERDFRKRPPQHPPECLVFVLCYFDLFLAFSTAL